MTAPVQDVQSLLEKIQSLPPDRIAEVAEVIDFVDFLREWTRTRKTATRGEPLNFPVDDLGPWAKGLSLHREDMYKDVERFAEFIRIEAI